jgi:DNA polymerase-3 subunit epsilon
MSLSRIAGPIAVIDVETTGLFPFRHDRVVEVAAVVVHVDGRVEREFVSLVNPARDVGPSSIHGLTSEDLLHAPRFEEIAAWILDALRGTVAIAAHNVRFDRQFLDSEFTRLNCQFPDCFSLCTMRLAGGGKLSDCCRDYDISPNADAHSALSDARAAAGLLACLLGDQPRAFQQLTELAPVHWPTVPQATKQPVTRDEAHRRQAEPPTYLQRLLTRMPGSALPDDDQGAVMAYGALLDRVLEDRHVDASEADALVETATRWGLGGDQVSLVHRDYVNRLAVAAVADEVVTDAERRDLNLVMRLLGQDTLDLDQVLSESAAKSERSPGPAAAQPANENLIGKRVCFTGELQCHHAGQMISREMAEAFAARAGLVVADSVTKKLDLLVLADPLTQSGKAAKARRYGIRIMHEPVFWKAIGVDVH